MIKGHQKENLGLNQKRTMIITYHTFKPNERRIMANIIALLVLSVSEETHTRTVTQNADGSVDLAFRIEFEAPRAENWVKELEKRVDYHTGKLQRLNEIYMECDRLLKCGECNEWDLSAADKACIKQEKVLDKAIYRARKAKEHIREAKIREVTTAVEGLSQLKVKGTEVQGKDYANVCSVVESSEYETETKLLHVHLNSVVVVGIREMAKMYTPPQILAALQLTDSGQEVYRLVTAAQRLQKKYSSFKIDIYGLKEWLAPDDNEI